MFTNINERIRPLFMFVHLTKRKKFLVRVRLFNKRTNFPPNSLRTVHRTFGSFTALQTIELHFNSYKQANEESYHNHVHLIFNNPKLQ
ncbi:hypothetical protein Hanom_Chr11g01026941 [Helianthus anomalus]